MTTEPAPRPADDDQAEATTGTAIDPAPARAKTRGPRSGTVIWGLILAACGAGVIATALGHRFDLGLAAIVVLGSAGVALLVTSLVRTVRH